MPLSNATVQALVPTPRNDGVLAQRLGGFATIAEALDYAAQGKTGFNFYGGKGQLAHVLPYSDLRHRAISTARKLLSSGLKRGQRVAVVAETGPDFMTVFFWLPICGPHSGTSAIQHVYRRQGCVHYQNRWHVPRGGRCCGYHV